VHIGIDVGGTHTDAVAVDGRRVLATVKTPTTADVTRGILEALRELTATGEVQAGAVSAVMIGTTHFTNAVVERRRLVPTACVRLAAPATAALPPMVDWPDDLRAAIGGHWYLAQGGHEVDGRAIAPLDPAELRRIAASIREQELRSIAISSVFSPVTAEFELEAAELFADEVPGVAISLSHEIGRIGLLERENATIMNACLRPLASEIVDAFRAALAELRIDAPVYLSQNDGTLMSVDYTERYPVATFASGPTNSMRGAAFLSGLEDCAVVDIGGTTADVGMLAHGFPREAAVSVDIGGVRTNFRMPDVLPLGIGGGSLVDTERAEVGPRSVGYELSRRGLVFGGDTLTATDLAVAAGRAEIGDPALVSGLDRALVERALRRVEERIAEVVDRMKTSREPVPVVVVGGGSVLLGDTLAGASELIKPPHFAVANAIGAAIGQVGGEVDRIFSLEETSRDEALAEAKREAVARATAAGAGAETVRIVDVDEVPLSYLPGSATRIRVKAVGDLELGRETVAGIH
jgi:N-methylhydantoinase A/oxoprolinase/acetone carboxylase beta subunit